MRANFQFVESFDQAISGKNCLKPPKYFTEPKLFKSGLANSSRLFIIFSEPPKILEIKRFTSMNKILLFQKNEFG